MCMSFADDAHLVADLINHNIQVIIVLVQFHSYSGSEYMLYPIPKTAMIFEHVATN